MSRFWLNYRHRRGKRAAAFLGAKVILDSPSLVQARMSAAALRIDQGMPFAVTGARSARPRSSSVPRGGAGLGRMLTPQEARALQESLAAAAPDRIVICPAQVEP